MKQTDNKAPNIRQPQPAPAAQSEHLAEPEWPGPANDITRPAQLLRLQRTIGNRAVRRLLQRRRYQQQQESVGEAPAIANSPRSPAQLQRNELENRILGGGSPQNSQQSHGGASPLSERITGATKSDSGQGDPFTSALGQAIMGLGQAVSQAAGGPVSWGNLYTPDARNRVGQLFFRTAEAEANQDPDDQLALQTLAQQLLPHLNAAGGPVEVYIVGYADHRHYSASNENLSEERARAVERTLRLYLTGGNPQVVVPNLRVIVVGTGVDPGSHAGGTTEEELAPFRRADVFIYEQFRKPEPGKQPEPPKQPEGPGRVVTNPELPTSRSWEAVLLSNSVVPPTTVGMRLIEILIRDTENNLAMEFMFTGAGTGGLSGSTTRSEVFPFTTQNPIRILDFRGLAQYTKGLAFDERAEGGIPTIDNLTLRGPKMMDLLPENVELKFKTTTTLISKGKPLGGAEGNLSQNSLATTY